MSNEDRNRCDDQAISDHLVRVTVEQWTRLFPLVKAVIGGDPGHWAVANKVGETESGAHVIQLPYFVPSKSLIELVDWLDETQLVLPFDWIAWVDGRSLDEIPLNDGADAIKMLNAILRKDRFCEGQLVSCVFDGSFARIFDVLESEYGAAKTD